MTDVLRGVHVLVGRRAKQHRLARLLRALFEGGDGPAGVLLRGEPGIGRTAMLAWAAAAAREMGARVVVARGTVGEHGLDHAVLTDLLLPLRPSFAALAPVQRAALTARLGLCRPRGSVPAGDLLVCSAVHEVLAAAGAESPLLVVVDDVQWVDAASRRVLLYAARRLGGTRVAVLLAHGDRPGAPDPVPDLDGLHTLRLGGLPEDACRELVAAAGGVVPAGTSLVQVTGGNPQALHDGLAAGSWAPLVLGPRLRREWAAAVRALPAPTRTALAVLTTAPSADVGELAPVFAALQLADADLEPARRAGLLRADPAGRGSADLPHPLLTAAVRAAVPAEVRARVLAVLAAHADGEPDGGGVGGHGLRATAAAVVATVLAGREPGARAAIPDHAPVGAADPWELQAGVFLAQSLLWLEDTGAARELLDRVIGVARAAAAGPVLAQALVVRAELDWLSGAWSASHATAAEALLRAGREAAALGPALVALARVDAARGDVDRCRERLDRAVRAARPGRLLPVQVPAVHGLAALGSGDVETAVAHLDQAWERATRDGIRGAEAIPVAAGLAEARVRAGRPERAAPLVQWLAERAEESGAAGAAAAAARCRGLLAADAATAQRCFAAAHRAHDRVDVPFERARTLLLEGETLRRLRRPALAREPLRAAVARFTALGARPWTRRAELELGATGVRRSAAEPAPEPADVTGLSPQELRIARTVAGGLNNAEAAAALYLSRKTVEAHLTRVYRKLGVRSRTDLVRRLGELPGVASR